MTSEVLFTPSHSSGKDDSLTLRVLEMLDSLGFADALHEGDSVAVKVHPGEKNNISYLRPSIACAIAERLSERGLEPFVTETTTLYSRQRFTRGELLHTSAGNGYTAETLGCPFVVADSGPDVEVRLDGRRLKTVGVASRIAGADALLVLSHFTCHCWMAGVGGAIKQLGMGCVGRRTKTEVHRSTDITIQDELCVGCGTCLDVCKSEGITLGEAAAINDDCVRCGVCIGACPEQAIGFRHDLEHFAEALGEAAAGAASCFEKSRAAYLNFLLDVTWHCDCEDFSDDPVFPDIGVLASLDPVAVDQASADLVNSRAPNPGTMADKPEVRDAKDKIFALSNIEWWRQLDSAERVGLGSRDYELKNLN